MTRPDAKAQQAFTESEKRFDAEQKAFPKGQLDRQQSQAQRCERHRDDELRRFAVAQGVFQPGFRAPAEQTALTLRLTRVLDEAGASKPQRDAVDRRVVQEVRTGQGKFIRAVAEVGGWPELASGTAPADGDQDGMPDAWEKTHGLDPADASDSRGDRDQDGYSNIEEYLNGTDPARQG